MLGDKRDLKEYLWVEGDYSSVKQIWKYGLFPKRTSVIVEGGMIAAHWRVEKAPEFLSGKRFSTVGTGAYRIRLMRKAV